MKQHQTPDTMTLSGVEMELRMADRFPTLQKNHIPIKKSLIYYKTTATNQQPVNV